LFQKTGKNIHNSLSNKSKIGKNIIAVSNIWFYRPYFAKNIKCLPLSKGIGSFSVTKNPETAYRTIVYKTTKNSKNESLTSENFLYTDYFCHYFVTPIWEWSDLVFGFENAQKNTHSYLINGLFLKGKCAIFIILSYTSFILSHALLLMSFYCLIFAVKIKNNHKKLST